MLNLKRLLSVYSRPNNLQLIVRLSAPKNYKHQIRHSRRIVSIMNADGWFNEVSDELWPGQCFSLKVKKVLHQEKSKYQDIQLVET